MEDFIKIMLNNNNVNPIAYYGVLIVWSLSGLAIVILSLKFSYTTFWQTDLGEKYINNKRNKAEKKALKKKEKEEKKKAKKEKKKEKLEDKEDKKKKKH